MDKALAGVSRVTVIVEKIRSIWFKILVLLLYLNFFEVNSENLLILLQDELFQGIQYKHSGYLSRRSRLSKPETKYHI